MDSVIEYVTVPFMGFDVLLLHSMESQSRIISPPLLPLH